MDTYILLYSTAPLYQLLTLFSPIVDIAYAYLCPRLCWHGTHTRMSLARVHVRGCLFPLSS